MERYKKKYSWCNLKDTLLKEVKIMRRMIGMRTLQSRGSVQYFIEGTKIRDDLGSSLSKAKDGKHVDALTSIW